METQTTAPTAAANQPFGPRKDPTPVFHVGDGATRHMYSDAQAGTITAVSANGKTVTWQRDTATLKPGHKPEMIPGGFVAHCTNNRSLEYDYAPDPAGSTRAFTLRKNGRWVETGQDMYTGDHLTAGRREFYDYNF